MIARRLLPLALPILLATAFAPLPVQAAGAGVANVPQGFQDNTSYANSFAANNVTNVFATTQQTSCYTPEVPYSVILPNDGYTGESACLNKKGRTLATTGEDLGPYASQAGSNPGFIAATPMVVKDHSESDIRVDPTNPMHLIASSKWIVSAEGYNHLLGFYESFDGGMTWPIQGHIPGYEGWTDNTDPVGAFDTFGNYYELVLPYEFYYNSDGSHNFQTNQNKEPNPSVPAEAITITKRAHGATSPNDWSTQTVASYPVKGREPDKQWIAIDTNPSSLHKNRIYAMWTVFNSLSAVPFVSFSDINSTGTGNSAWSTPQVLPTAGSNPQGDTYHLPHVDGNGAVYTTVTNFEPKQGFCCTSILLDKSTDGGVTWQSVSKVIDDVSAPSLLYANTQFRDGIEDTFTIGPNPVSANSRIFPMYVSWEDKSTGFGNVILRGSFDGGVTWSAPIQVNDNPDTTSATSADAFQPNLTAAADGTVSVAFYDRRLACPAAGTDEAAGAGLALDADQSNANYTGAQGPLPPYGFHNYCVNSTIQFYRPDLTLYDAPYKHNIRTSLHTWDPQLNEPKPAGAFASEGFIGDYYGNITGLAPSGGLNDYTTSVSTFNDTSLPANQQNPGNYQQQVIAIVSVP